MLNIHNCSYHLLLIRTLIFFGSTRIICGPSCLLWWFCIKLGETLIIVHGFGSIPLFSTEIKPHMQWNAVSQGQSVQKLQDGNKNSSRGVFGVLGVGVGAPALLSCLLRGWLEWGACTKTSATIPLTQPLERLQSCTETSALALGVLSW